MNATPLIDVTGPRSDLKVVTENRMLIPVTASSLRASPCLVTEGVTEGGAVDVTGPRGDLGGADLQKVGTVNGVWIPVTARSLRASSYLFMEGGQKVLLKM